MGKLNVKTIAGILKVSAATVSRAIHAESDISKDAGGGWAYIPTYFAPRQTFLLKLIRLLIADAARSPLETAHS